MTSIDAPNPISESYSCGDGWVRKTLHTPGGTTESSRPAISAEGSPREQWLRSYMLGGVHTRESIRLPSVRSVELFCGSGGLALGFGEACRDIGSTLESEAAVDTDMSALEVYQANNRTKMVQRKPISATEIAWGTFSGKAAAARWTDLPYLTNESWEDLRGRVDVVLAGPPCQGHSNLNNHSRRTDNRNKLYFTVPMVAIALEAEIVVIENVPAVQHDSSQVVETTRQLLKEAGYYVESGTVSAIRFGWPQTRQRFFMVARRSRPPLPIAAVQQSFDDGSRHDVMWAISDLMAQPLDQRLHLHTELSEENQRRIGFLFDHDLYDLPTSERPECHRDGTTYNAVYGRLHPDRPSPTITTGFLTPGRGRYIHPFLRRTLTPHEAARLQGFPDAYNFFPNPNNPATKVNLTKWIGDAVPMPLGYVAGISALGNGWTRTVSL